MSARRVRSTRLVALAVATGTVVVASGMPAMAAAHDTTPAASSYAGKTGGFAIKLGLHLPGALSALNIDETIAVANGVVTKTTSLVGNGTAQLFQSDGLLSPVFNALNKVVNVAIGGKLEDSQTLGSSGDSPVGSLVAGALGLVSGKLVPVVNGITQSLLQSKVGELNVGLDPSLINSVQTTLTGITGTLNTVLQQVTGTLVPTVTNTLSSLLGGVLGPSNPLNSTVQGLLNTLQSLPDTVTGLVNNLSKALTDILKNGLVSLKLLSTDQQIVPSGAGLKAITTSSLANLSLLGGLLQVDPLKTVATAVASGAPGGASADITKSLLNVHLGNQLQQIIDALTGALKQVTSTLGLPDVTSALNGAASGLVDQINTLLNTVNGLVLQPLFGALGSDVKQAAADGTSATAATSGFGIQVPLPAALGTLLGATGAATSAAKAHAAAPLDLLDVQVVPASASVEQIRQSTVAPAPSLPKPKAVAPSPHKKLAYTGAELPITAGVASVLLVGAAAAARRRRSSTEV
jgi:hypothetical protein